MQVAWDARRTALRDASTALDTACCPKDTVQALGTSDSSIHRAGQSQRRLQALGSSGSKRGFLVHRQPPDCRVTRVHKLPDVVLVLCRGSTVTFEVPMTDMDVVEVSHMQFLRPHITPGAYLYPSR
jgi:hypothetical protein